MDFYECLEVLEQWYEFHHGDCDDQTTCAMSEAWSQGLTVLAIQLLIDAVGIDVGNTHNKVLEEKALKAYLIIRQLPRLRTMWNDDFKDQTEYLHNEVSNQECSECFAVIWQPEFCDGYCSSCGTTNKVKGDK